MRQGHWAAWAREGRVDSAPYSRNVQISLWVLLCVFLKQN